MSKVLEELSNIAVSDLIKSSSPSIKLSKGKYLAFLDSDDIWRKNKLKDQVKFMDKFNYNISHTSYEIIDEMEKKIALRRSSNLDFKKLWLSKKAKEEVK